MGSGEMVEVKWSLWPVYVPHTHTHTQNAEENCPLVASLAKTFGGERSWANECFFERKGSARISTFKHDFRNNNFSRAVQNPPILPGNKQNKDAFSVKELSAQAFQQHRWYSQPAWPCTTPVTRHHRLPLLISCLAAINKNVHFNSHVFFFSFLNTPSLNQRHISSNQQCLDFPVCCVVLGRVFLLFFWFFCRVSKCEKVLFLLLWLAKDPSPAKAPPPPKNISKADSKFFFCQKLHPGCRDCTNPCSCTVLTVKTTSKTLLVIKKKKHLYLFF